MTFAAYNPATHTLSQLVNAIVGSNSGISVIPGSITLKSGNESLSFYDGSIAGLGIGAGLLLTSGDGTPPGSNTEPMYSVSSSPSETDTSLTSAAQAAFITFTDTVQDATVVQFQFTVSDPNLVGIRLNLSFASDEYEEFIDSEFADIAGVFLNGTNYALFNGLSTRPLSVISENLNVDPSTFLDNRTGVLPIEYDGILRQLSVVAPVQPGVNTIKIGVADTGDDILDSALFVSNFQGVPYTGGEVLPVALGTNGADALNGLSYNELFDALGGPDTIRGSGGSDIILGGTGIDTALYTGNRASFTVTRTGSAYNVNGPEGNDKLLSVERVHFTDRKIAVDLGSGEAANNTARVIGAAFDAPAIPQHPDWVGIGLQLFDAGASMRSVCELVAPIMGLDNTSFVTAVFTNVVGFAPDAATRASFVGLLAGSGGGMTQGQLLELAANTDLNAQNINLVGLAQMGVDFI